MLMKGNSREPWNQEHFSLMIFRKKGKKTDEGDTGQIPSARKPMWKELGHASPGFSRMRKMMKICLRAKYSLSSRSSWQLPLPCSQAVRKWADLMHLVSVLCCGHRAFCTPTPSMSVQRHKCQQQGKGYFIKNEKSTTQEGQGFWLSITMTTNVSGILQFAYKASSVILVDPHYSLVRWAAQVVALISQKPELERRNLLQQSLINIKTQLMLKSLCYQHPLCSLRDTSGYTITLPHWRGKGLPQHFPGEVVTTIKSSK